MSQSDTSHNSDDYPSMEDSVAGGSCVDAFLSASGVVSTCFSRGAQCMREEDWAGAEAQFRNGLQTGPQIQI